jgi:hypothetical protein
VGASVGDFLGGLQGYAICVRRIKKASDFCFRGFMSVLTS